MGWNREVLERVSVLCLIGLVAATMACGCSSVDPSERWSEATGSVSGTVRSSESHPVDGIEVWLWTELPFDGGEIRYDTRTDQWGHYEFPAVEMANQHSFEQRYDVCGNRTPDRASSSNSDFGTFWSTVTVERDGECVVDMVLDAIDSDPDDPESYIDD
ncbi:MAG: hypothetical protein JXB46_05235 [Candidatus Eisenbacteria bacterium]|nr:hypothetical protein [Candidatus Eisenbacteria bacterium]